MSFINRCITKLKNQINYNIINYIKSTTGELEIDQYLLNSLSLQVINDVHAIINNNNNNNNNSNNNNNNNNNNNKNNNNNMNIRNNNSLNMNISNSNNYYKEQPKIATSSKCIRRRKN
ncbi:hypothetical protein ACTFIZ_008184 [Dictyostelium cf. discoideum]